MKKHVLLPALLPAVLLLTPTAAIANNTEQAPYAHEVSASSSQSIFTRADLEDHLRRNRVAEDKISSLADKILRGETMDSDREGTEPTKTLNYTANGSHITESHYADGSVTFLQIEDPDLKGPRSRAISDCTNTTDTWTVHKRNCLISGWNISGYAQFRASYIITKRGGARITEVYSEEAGAYLGTHSKPDLRIVRERAGRLPAEAKLTYKYTGMSVGSFSNIYSGTNTLRFKITYRGKTSTQFG